MTISQPHALLGSQAPRLDVRPPGAVTSSGPEVAELCASAGLILDPWERLALDVIHGERADGLWAAFEAGLVVARQNGKGSVLVAVELGALFLFREELTLHSAHEFKTSSEAFRRILSYIDGCDDLRRKVSKVRTSHGEEAIELLGRWGGCRLRFVARSTGSGRGFTADRVVLDEAYRLGPAAMAALLPTLSARPNPQIVYASSAPLADSVQLHDVRRRALEGGSGRLAYLEWSIDPDVDEDDNPASWAKANPALGIRISEEFIRAEMGAMPLPEFRRERLGVPDMPAGSVPPLFGPGGWPAVLKPEREVKRDGAWIGVEVSSDRGWASIGASDGLAVELVDRREGTTWMAARLAEVLARYRVAGVVADVSGAAGGVVEDLRRVAGGLLFEASGRDLARSCGAFHDAVVAGEVSHRGQPELDLAVGGAARRVRGDAFVWDRRGQVDVSALVAVTLAFGQARRLVTTPVPVVVFA